METAPWDFVACFPPYQLLSSLPSQLDQLCDLDRRIYTVVCLTLKLLVCKSSKYFKLSKCISVLKIIKILNHDPISVKHFICPQWKGCIMQYIFCLLYRYTSVGKNFFLLSKALIVFSQSCRERFTKRNLLACAFLCFLGWYRRWTRDPIIALKHRGQVFMICHL